MDRLMQKKKEGLMECVYKIQHWKKFKSDYDALEEHLNSLADKLSYDIMVPFGPKAFMPGTMVHTNNITVLLGENWFTEMSAKQAVEFIKRRKQQCEEMLTDLEKEQKQYQNWLDTSKHISEEQPFEIIESCDDEQLAKWREQHRKSVIAHKRKEAQERNVVSKMDNYVESSNMNGIQAEDKEDAYCEQLDDLMMEEYPKEIINSNSETEDDLSDESEDDDFEAESMNTDSIAEGSEYNPLQNSNSENNGTSVMNNENQRHNKHVRWIDISEAKSKCINFTHSKLPPTQHYYKKRNKRKRRNSSTSDFDEEESEEKNENGSPLINSPSDIYKYFNFALQQFKPRSILKSNSTETKHSHDVIQNPEMDNNDNDESTMEYEDSEKYINTFLARKMGENLAFTGEITEHPVNALEANSAPRERPKSLFRSSRENTSHR